MPTATIKSLLVALALGLTAFVLSSLGINTQQAYLVGLITLLVVLWSNEALPLGAVSLMPIVLFPAFGINATDEVTRHYANPIIYLFIGGFLLAIAVEKVGLHRVIAQRMLRIFPPTVRGMIFALAITSGCLSAFLSNTTTSLLLIPLALFLSEDAAVRLRLALAVAYGASIGGIITPLGTPPNMILFGLLDELKIAPIPFMQWVVMVFPLAATMFVVVGALLSRGTEHFIIRTDNTATALTKDQKKVMAALLILIVLLIVNSPFEPAYSGLGLNEKGILLSFGLLMFLPPFSILNWADTKKIPFEVVFLFGAGFSIAAAVSSTGLADILADSLDSLAYLPLILLVILVATMTTFATEITSNTALISLLLPVLYAVTVQNNLDPLLFMMVATVCSSYAFMLPIATPPNAIAMSSGAVKVKDMVRFGLLLNLSGITLVTFISLTYWRLFL